MNLAKYEGVKTSEMVRVLRKLGYRQLGKPGKSIRCFENNEGVFASTPVDLEEEMFPKSVWWLRNLIRLPDVEFERLRQEH